MCVGTNPKEEESYMTSRLASASSPIIFTVCCFTLVGCLIVVLWTLLWKFVLEPNPIIREFFDLDRRRKDTKDTKTTKKEEINKNKKKKS